MRGQTERVARLLRAYELVQSEDRHPLFKPPVSATRTAALRARISAILPLLSHDETTAYYAAIQRLRAMGMRAE